MTKEQIEQTSKITEFARNMVKQSNYPKDLQDHIIATCMVVVTEATKELEKEKCELLGIIQGKDTVIKDLTAQIEKMRNFQNCDYQLHITDCPIFKSGGHISCKECPHWILQEIKGK